MHAPWAVSGKKIPWQDCTLSCRDHAVATSLGFSVYLKASALKIPYDHKKRVLTHLIRNFSEHYSTYHLKNFIQQY